MMALLVAACAGLGTYLLYSALVLGAGPLTLRRRAGRDGRPTARSDRRQDWLVQAGLVDVRLRDIAAVMVVLAVVGGVIGWTMFPSPAPTLFIGVTAGLTPLRMYRARRQARRATAQEAWPRLIEEIRILTGSLGRSVPQALFDAGRRGPTELRPAFDAAHREWLLSVDFARTLDVLKEHLADRTADATCETLLVAHEVGGTDLGRRLEALAEDRQIDAGARKDARAKQAGVRFARRFVLVVPAGMALAGTMIGTGRDAYSTPIGSAIVVVALVLVAVCWAWSGRYLRLPEPGRVFRSSAEAEPLARRQQRNRVALARTGGAATAVAPAAPAPARAEATVR